MGRSFLGFLEVLGALETNSDEIQTRQVKTPKFLFQCLTQRLTFRWIPRTTNPKSRGFGKRWRRPAPAFRRWTSLVCIISPTLFLLCAGIFVVMKWSALKPKPNICKMHWGTTLSKKNFSLKELSLGERQPQAHLWYSPSMKGQTRRTCMPRS